MRLLRGAPPPSLLLMIRPVDTDQYSPDLLHEQLAIHGISFRADTGLLVLLGRYGRNPQDSSAFE